MKVLAGVLALALGCGACLGGGKNVGKTLRVASMSGTVEVQASPAAAWAPARVGQRIAPGGSVRTSAGAAAALARDDGARLEVGPSSLIVVQTVRKVSLDLGRVLAATNDLTLTVSLAGIEAHGTRSTFRVDRDFSERVGVYSGEVLVIGDSSTVTVSPLQQVELTGGVLPRDTVPLIISPTDPWDRTQLADVLDLDRQLRGYGRAFVHDFGSKARDPEFYRGLAPSISAPALAASLSQTDDPADVLFGVLMAVHLKGDVAGVLGRLLGLRRAGATWGLLAKTFHIGARDFIAIVVAAFLPASPSPTPAGPGPTTGNPSPSPTSGPRPTHSPSPRPTRSPSPSPSPTPTCSAIDALLGHCSSANTLL
ncbi:MAG: hypothetical protein ABR548_11430 [Actinomycetota bacterium]